MLATDVTYAGVQMFRVSVRVSIRILPLVTYADLHIHILFMAVFWCFLKMSSNMSCECSSAVRLFESSGSSTVKLQLL